MDTLNPRIVVVQAEGFPAEDPPAVPVGTLRWRGAMERLVVIVKATFSAAPSSEYVVWSPAQLPLSRGARHWLPGALPEEIGIPNDFVPRKEGADVVLVGHAYAARPAAHIEASLRVDRLVRGFTVRASAPALAIPLTAAYLAPHEPCSALLTAAPEGGARDDEPADFSRYNAAPRSQRAAQIDESAALELVNLSPGGGARTVRLAGWHPVVTVSDDWEGERAVEMRLDTLWIDVDRALLSLVWRGEIGLYEGPHNLSRIVVAMERRGHERSPEERQRALQRGHFALAVRPEDAGQESSAPDEDEADRLQAARYATWLSAAPEPRLSLDLYAALSVELADARAPRPEILARHGLDEDRFLIEERAWLEGIARRAMAGDTSLAERHAEALGRAEAAAAPPEEQITLDAFLKVRREVSHADDAAAALRAHGLSVGRYLRLERHFAAAAERDPAVGEALARADAEEAGAEEAGAR